MSSANIVDYVNSKSLSVEMPPGNISIKMNCYAPKVGVKFQTDFFDVLYRGGRIFLEFHDYHRIVSVVVNYSHGPKTTYATKDRGESFIAELMRYDDVTSSVILRFMTGETRSFKVGSHIVEEPKFVRECLGANVYPTHGDNSFTISDALGFGNSTFTVIPFHSVFDGNACTIESVSALSCLSMIKDGIVDVANFADRLNGVSGYLLRRMMMDDQVHLHGGYFEQESMSMAQPDGSAADPHPGLTCHEAFSVRIMAAPQNCKCAIMDFIYVNAEHNYERESAMYKSAAPGCASIKMLEWYRLSMYKARDMRRNFQATSREPCNCGMHTKRFDITSSSDPMQIE